MLEVRNRYAQELIQTLPGFGREGLRYAIEEMTELKILVLNLR